MGSPRWLIGLIMAFVLLSIVGNIIEQAGILTADQIGYLQSMTEAEMVEAKDPDTGGTVTYGGTPKSMIEMIVDAITMDWAWLYDVNDAGEQTPNNFYYIWAIIYIPIMIGILFELFVLALRLIRGI